MSGSLSALYENSQLLTAAQKEGIITVTDTHQKSVDNALSKDFGFDSNGDISISLTWADLAANPVYVSDTKQIRFSATISPAEPIVASKIYWARTDSFDIQCDYPVEMTIKTTFDTHQNAISDTSIGTTTSNDMIGEFTLSSYKNSDYTETITSGSPISVGSPIYTRITVADFPASLTYQVLNCAVQNTANANWETDSDFIKLWQDQTCLNDNIQAVGITVDGNDGGSSYSFSFDAFTFTSNSAEQNTLTIACGIHVCSSDTVVSEITCQNAVTDATQCETGYSLLATTGN